MPKVGIVMGSDSDLKVMSKAAATLEKFGIDYEMTIISAHRMPDVFFDWAKAAEGKGIKVIITCSCNNYFDSLSFSGQRQLKERESK